MSVLKHTDDDGDLSVIAAADQILIACSGGHYWILEADRHEVDARKPRAEFHQPEKFGARAFDAMNLR